MSQALSSPSNVPEITFVKLEGHLLIADIESECPVNYPKKGFANILSSLVAVNAL